MSEKHTALIVEDDAATATAIAKLLRSIDHDCVKAPTIEDARGILEVGGFCYIVADQQMVASPGDAPDVGVGMAFLRQARARFPEKGTAGHHRVQILAMSAHLRTPSDGAKTIKYGADDFIEKPFTSDDFLRAVEEMVVRAGRSEHGVGCSRVGDVPQVAPVPIATSEPKALALEVSGNVEDGKTLIRLSGKEVRLGDTSLFILLKLVEARLRDPNEWVPLDKLGGRAGQGFNGVSRLDKEVHMSIPSLRVHKNSPGTGWRLAPSIGVESIDFAALRVHPDPRVQNLMDVIERLFSRHQRESAVPLAPKQARR
jgi:DNA-binding response OmpR family regulator